MFSETPLLQPIKPRQHFHMVDEEQIQTLANGTLEILADTAVHCLNGYPGILLDFRDEPFSRRDYFRIQIEKRMDQVVQPVHG